MHRGKITTMFSIGLIIVLSLLLNALFRTAQSPPREGRGAETTQADPVFDPLFARYFADLDAAWTAGQISTEGQYRNLQNKGQDAQAYLAAQEITKAYHVLNALLNELQAAAGNQVFEPDASHLIADVQAISEALNQQVTSTPLTPTATDSPSATAFPTDAAITVEATWTSTSISPTLTPSPTPFATLTPTPMPESCTGSPMVEQLTVWSEPTLQSTRLGFINPGAVYPVYDFVDNGDTAQAHTQFYLIGYQGALAWTPALYVRLSGDCSGIESPLVTTHVAPTVAPGLRTEAWTLFSEYVWSDPCAGAATGNVTVPVTLEFDESGLLRTLSWYSRVWVMQPGEGQSYSGVAVVEDTELEQIVDTLYLVFVTPQTFEGNMTRTVTSRPSQLVCTATYEWVGSR